MRKPNTLRILLVVPLLAPWSLGGCKSSTTPALVKGTVKYNGMPVTGGTITFITENIHEGGPYTVVIQPDGSYVAPALPAGEMIVLVETESFNPTPKGRPEPNPMIAGRSGYHPKEMMKMLQENGRLPPTAGQPNGTYVEIPAKYANIKTTPLRVTLTKGTNLYDPELED